jgi:hypothetical protein
MDLTLQMKNSVCDFSEGNITCIIYLSEYCKSNFLFPYLKNLELPDKECF